MSDGSKEELEDKLRNLIIESRILEGTASEIQARIGVVDAAAREYRVSELTLAGLKEVGKGSEILVPIGGGSYLKASIADVENVVTGIGAGVTLEKRLPEAESYVKTRIEELKKVRSALEEQFSQVMGRMQAVRREMEQVIAKLRM
ncbi:MAG: prefoldin subunit alpha [Candidatus Bathyarchaeia archaeon]